MTSIPDTDGPAPSSADAALVDAPRKPRASRRIPKTDSVLEAASERARLGVLEVAPEAQVGRHISAVIEGERLVTHRFEAFVPGYGGWQWFATVARVARSKEVTVCEVGLVPSPASLLAPEWLPWSERVRPEDSQPDEQQTGQEPGPGTAAGLLENSDGTDGVPVATNDESQGGVEVSEPDGSDDAMEAEAGEVPEQPDSE